MRSRRRRWHHTAIDPSKIHPTATTNQDLKRVDGEKNEGRISHPLTLIHLVDGEHPSRNTPKEYPGSLEDRHLQAGLRRVRKFK
jgi:hypothetical protein